MKILALGHRFSGCFYHRIWLPSMLMEGKERARVTDTITEDTFKEKWDIVFINRMWAKDDLFKLRDEYGFKLVLDMDDYWVLDHHHMDYDHYTDGRYDSRVVQHIKLADLVTCTHERLAERIRPYNENVVICPNAIPYGHGQYIDQVEPTEKIKLFWAGGISHELDLKVIAEPMKKLFPHIKDKVKCYIGGYADGNPYEAGIWGKMADYFMYNGNYDGTALRGMPVDEYYQLFSYADIMLIPLKKSNFNQYKSNLKILEAAGKRIPVVVSAVHPYLGFPEDLVNYASDSQMWIHWVNKLVNDKGFRLEQGERLYEYCKTHYNFFEINKKRQEAFTSLIPVNT